MNINFFNSTNQMLASVILGAILVFVIIGLAIKLLRGRKNQKYFTKKWKELQLNCKDKENWAKAITEADDLLGEALKRAKIRGKSKSERLVFAQKKFSDNEEVWIAHKLRTKLDDHPNTTLKKTDVKNSLIAFGRALKDLEVM